MTERHGFGAVPQPTGGQISAVKYRGSVRRIRFTRMDSKTKRTDFLKSHLSQVKLEDILHTQFPAY